MFKQKTVLEVKGGEERIHCFQCDPNSPLGEVHDALCVMRSYVLEQMNNQAQENSEDHCESDQKCDKDCEEAKEKE